MKNEPAFPYWENSETKGMSLRDYFAAKAMQAYLSDPDWRRDTEQIITAKIAYSMADDMLLARK